MGLIDAELLKEKIKKYELNNIEKMSIIYLVDSMTTVEELNNAESEELKIKLSSLEHFNENMYSNIRFLEGKVSAFEYVIDSIFSNYNFQKIQQLCLKHNTRGENNETD